MLEKCDSVHSFKKNAPTLIRNKVTALERPLEEMEINPIQKSKYFSREADILLLCLTNEIGYGKWTQIKHAIRRDSRVRFDHLLMSRNEAELQKRIDILVKTIEKENEADKNVPNRQNFCDDDFMMEDEEMESANNDKNNDVSDQHMKSQASDDEEDDEAEIRVGMGGHDSPNKV
jgi:hypothetical protein